MSVTSPRGESYTAVYGVGLGRGDLEVHVVQTLRDWIIAYVADYEAERGLPPRTLPIPPTSDSIHGSLDFTTFIQDLLPELIVVAQPLGEVERYGDDGTYGAWYDIGVAAVVQVEGDQNLARAMADAYGTALQKLLPQQGAFGTNPDGTPFATRTRLTNAYSLTFPDATVRDVVRATVVARTYIYQLAEDFEGPRVPPLNPYGDPAPWPDANRVEVNVVEATPDQYDAGGTFTSDSIIIDGTVNPPVTELERIILDVLPEES